MKEDLKIEELNGMELLKLIYEEVKNTRTELNEKIDKVYNELNEKIDKVYNELNEKIDKVYNELNEKIKILEEKIDTIYNELNEKIDNTKNTLVIEIAEELSNFSAMTAKSINNLEQRIDNEKEDRIVDISKIKDFNRIILNDMRSRISILEEETEKYNLK